MLLDTREHVAEFNNPGPALAISDDELRCAVRDATILLGPARSGMTASLIDVDWRTNTGLHMQPRLDIRPVDDRGGI